MQGALFSSSYNTGSPFDINKCSGTAFDDCFPQQLSCADQNCDAAQSARHEQQPTAKKRKYKPIAQQSSERDLIRANIVDDLAAAAKSNIDPLVSLAPMLLLQPPVNLLLFHMPQGGIWGATHDPYLVSAVNKTIPVVSTLHDGTTIHLVGGNKVPLSQISITDLPHPKNTAEIILTYQEINAVINCGDSQLADKVLFINSRDIRDTGTEAESFKVRKDSKLTHYIFFTPSYICASNSTTPIMQRQAKRRYVRLTEQGTTMLDIMERDMTTVLPPKCFATKKHDQNKVPCGNSTSLALLSCNNHYKAYATWGDVSL